MLDSAVDNLDGSQWLGTVLPKRHAKRAVTRNLLRRLIRSAVQARAAGLPAGLWLVRLREPFPVVRFASASSAALRSAAHDELQGLMRRLSLS